MISRAVVCGTNWIGDGVMSMPALQAFRRAFPACGTMMLCKPNLRELWAMHKAIDRVAELRPGPAGMRAAVRALRDWVPDCAFVFPNSFRSALVPFLARVPQRVGGAGHLRAWMLTRITAPQSDPDRAHQAWEYMDIVGQAVQGTTPAALDVPMLNPPEEARRAAAALVKDLPPASLVGLAPGAARGPSKRWPARHFAELGKVLVKHGRAVVVLGSAGEAQTCSRIAGDIGPAAVNAAGRTTLPELAALLSLCETVVANDSGSMHLATAVGTRVVAIFGITNPAQTGPLGDGHVIVAQEGAVCGRDIPRKSGFAREVLESIRPETVSAAVMR